MNTKMQAAVIATKSDMDMVIANSNDLRVIHKILKGENIGTLFLKNPDEGFDLPGFVEDLNR